MSEFEVGDRVIVTNYDSDLSDYAKALIIGQPGTITRVKQDFVEVELDNIVADHDGTWALYDYELEKLL